MSKDGWLTMTLPLVNQILLGDALKILKSLPDDSIDGCVTSPPYFQLCDYQVDGQLGLEATIDEYLTNLTAVFTEVHRTLFNGGVLWLVIGDTMSNYSPIRAKGQRRKAGEYLKRRDRQVGYFEKEPMGIPTLLIDWLRLSGWRHRNTLIWDKGTSGAIANSDTAPTTHELVLQFVKWQGNGRMMANCDAIKSSVLHHRPASDPFHPCPMPEGLASQLIRPLKGEVILDPFMGAGTTAVAALQNGRSFIGIELNPDYRAIAISRLTTATTEIGVECKRQKLDVKQLALDVFLSTTDGRDAG